MTKAFARLNAKKGRMGTQRRDPGSLPKGGDAKQKPFHREEMKKRKKSWLDREALETAKTGLKYPN